MPRTWRTKKSSGRCISVAGSMPRRRHASTERGEVGWQAAALAPASIARSATSRMVTLGRPLAAAASRRRSRSASQLWHEGRMCRHGRLRCGGAGAVPPEGEQHEHPHSGCCAGKQGRQRSLKLAHLYTGRLLAGPGRGAGPGLPPRVGEPDAGPATGAKGRPAVTGGGGGGRNSGSCGLPRWPAGPEHRWFCEALERRAAPNANSDAGELTVARHGGSGGGRDARDQRRLQTGLCGAEGVASGATTLWAGGRRPVAGPKQSYRGSKEVEGPGRRQRAGTGEQSRAPGWTTQCGDPKSPQPAMCQRSGIAVSQTPNCDTPRALKRCRRCSPLRPGR